MPNGNKIINTEALDEYNNKDTSRTKRLYIIFISIISLTISIMIIFIFIFRYHIYAFQTKSSSLSSNIIKKSNNSNKVNKISDKMLLNLEGLFKDYLFLQTSNIKSMDEFNLIRQWTGEKKRIIICYKGTFDISNKNGFEDYCTNRRWLVFVFKTESRKRIGAIIFNADYIRDYYHYDEKAFLFSFDNQKKFAINNPSKAFKFNRGGDNDNNNDNANDNANDNDYLFQFGDDLMISKDYLFNKNSRAQFPIDYGTSNDKLNDLTGGESSFRIIELEIFSDYYSSLNYWD